MEKIRRIHPSIKKNIRYKLCDKMELGRKQALYEVV